MIKQIRSNILAVLLVTFLVVLFWGTLFLMGAICYLVFNWAYGLAGMNMVWTVSMICLIIPSLISVILFGDIKKGE